MSEAPEFYQIIRQKLFDAQLVSICDSYNRMKEVDMAIDWALCRFNAKEMEDDIIPLGKKNYYMWILSRLLIPGFVQVRIVFHVDEFHKKITLIEISEE